MKTRVLIVDDEPIARRGIRRYLAKHNDIEVVGEAANGISAVEQINELHPDIVFLDLQMPDLDGFGVIENVGPSTGPVPVYIFVTAHDAHAIRAFEVHQRQCLSCVLSCEILLAVCRIANMDEGHPMRYRAALTCPIASCFGRIIKILNCLFRKIGRYSSSSRSLRL